MTNFWTETKKEFYLATLSMVLFLLQLSLVTISENKNPDLVFWLKSIMIFVTLVITCVLQTKTDNRPSTPSCIQDPLQPADATNVVQRLGSVSKAYQPIRQHDEENDLNNGSLEALETFYEKFFPPGSTLSRNPTLDPIPEVNPAFQSLSASSNALDNLGQTRADS